VESKKKETSNCVASAANSVIRPLIQWRQENGEKKEGSTAASKQQFKEEVRLGDKGLKM